ncbi:toxin-antitoxin system YwqK family antitoxin [Trinickia sp.]|uniref:toxin-antitoxin system YwqK family antitoxin n=1 Tax=Trinickia sp. TaxID=2571163 RepID=UPI003F7EB02F
MTDLAIAEVFYESGALRYRYARYQAPDGSRWIRHGLFVAYHENGAVASEGGYEHGVEHGPWKDFHPNGQLAALGCYDRGTEVDPWQYWDAEGQPET